jgi:hypothetical protein
MVVRHRSRVLDAAADAADPADDEQPGHYGGAGEQSTGQRVRLNHCRAFSANLGLVATWFI